MPFHPAHEMHFAVAENRRERLTAGVLVLAVHVVLVPLLFFGLASQMVPIGDQITIVDLLRSAVKAPRDVPPALRRPRLAVLTVPAPDIVIETPAPKPSEPAPMVATVADGAIAMSTGDGGAGAKPSVSKGGGAPVSGELDLSDYLRRVARHIEAHLITPTKLSMAYLRHETTGTVLVHLIFRPDGTVQLVNIARSSGVQAFDDAALAAVHRADPLPPFPPDVPLDHINGVLPISFTVNAGKK